MFIVKVCQALEKAKVPYAVVGGYAVALHGAVRGTIDVDIVIKWTLENLKKVEKTFREMGLVSRLPITAENVFERRDEYMEERNLIAWNFYNPSKLLEQVDLIISFDLKSADIDFVDVKQGKIRILSRKDLIAMKQESGRPQDLEDVKALKQL